MEEDFKIFNVIGYQRSRPHFVLASDKADAAEKWNSILAPHSPLRITKTGVEQVFSTEEGYHTIGEGGNEIKFPYGNDIVDMEALKQAYL